MSEREKTAFDQFRKLTEEQQEAVRTIIDCNAQVNEIIARRNEQKAAEPQAAAG